MNQVVHTRRPPHGGRAESAPPLRDLGVGAVLLVLVSSATCRLLGLPASHLLLAVALYSAMAGLILRYIPRNRPGPGIGDANRITLGRATLVVTVTTVAVAAGPLTGPGYWWMLLLAASAMILDGVDGRVARTTGTEGEFGARFDMEIDALLILALSVLVWQSGKVEGWVLLIGSLRYLFVLAGLLWPPLRESLPPRSGRKTICVVQSVVLVACIAPIIPSTLATPAAVVALLLLVYSFARDTWWLASTRRRVAPG